MALQTVFLLKHVKDRCLRNCLETTSVELCRSFLSYFWRVESTNLPALWFTNKSNAHRVSWSPDEGSWSAGCSKTKPFSSVTAFSANSLAFKWLPNPLNHSHQQDVHIRRRQQRSNGRHSRENHSKTSNPTSLKEELGILIKRLGKQYAWKRRITRLSLMIWTS